MESKIQAYKIVKPKENTSHLEKNNWLYWALILNYLFYL